jgi:hypothetical protein
LFPESKSSVRKKLGAPGIDLETWDSSNSSYSLSINWALFIVHCSLTMKIFLAILAVLLVAGSFYADYKWRQWITARHRNRH